MSAFAVEPPSDSAGSAGRATYLRHCARCHQTDGSGIDNLYPSLRERAASWQDRQSAIRTVLAGRTGTLTVEGITLDNVMPTHGYLGNGTVAETLSYVVREWGPDNSLFDAPFSPEEVANVRLDMLSARHRTPDVLDGPSPLADMEAVQYVTSDGPPITVAEFERARRLYYGHCTGCHGVLRQGTAGNPLTPELMRERGSEYLMQAIGFGSSRGMPGWGSAGELDGDDISLLARFLQHPVPEPPDMDPFQIRDGWHQQRIPGQRPAAPQHNRDLDRMFVATLHDVGEIALIDGVDRSVFARVPVGRAPHRVAASASGRYLYVMGRDGIVTLVDLYANPPERVASVRIGYEARALAASAFPGYEDAYVLAGAFWPPQLVLLDGQTLEPLGMISTRGYSSGSRRYHPEPRVSDIVASRRRPEFISQIKETGHSYLVPYDRVDQLQVRDIPTTPELRAGSFSSDGRYFLTPTDSNAVSVLDVERGIIVSEIPARVFGGNPGSAYVHPEFGPVWATTTMVENQVLVIGTDPSGHPEQAWQVVQQVPGPATGSLFLASHSASPHLWMDTPLSASASASQSLAVFDKSNLEGGYQTLPVAEWSGLATGPRRVLAPTYSVDGAEVWVLVWNPQDQASAIVVVDDGTLEPLATLRLPELITPTRLYSVAALRNGAPVPEPTTAPAVPRYSGAELYAANCANCHGTYGEGNGAVTPALSVVLQDLRYLSARNDGEFPGDFVRSIIDGRATRAAHGPEGMPVWGAEFARGEGFDESADTRVNAKIDALTRHLESMQVLR